MSGEDQGEPDKGSRSVHAKIRKKALEDLLESKGWSILVGIMQEQVEARTNQVVLLPIGEKFSIHEQEFMKGEITAYRTLMQLPVSEIEQSAAIIQAMPDGELEDEEEGE